MKRIIFSSHALERMEERGISQEFVIKAISSPDKIEEDANHSSRFLIKKLYFNQALAREHLLMIVFEINSSLIKVITIIDTSKISKYF